MGVYQSKTEPVVHAAEASTEKTAVKSNRIYEFDNLKSVSIFSVVLSHVSLNYMTVGERFYFATNPEYTSFHADLLVSVFVLFVMPLLWITTGFLIQMQIDRRGVATMSRTRLRSFGLPLLILGPPVLVAMYLTQLMAHSMADAPDDFLTVFRQTLVAHLSNPVSRIPYISVRHLWYLYYGVFYVGILYIIYESKLFRAVLKSKTTNLLMAVVVFGFFIYLWRDELTINGDTNILPNPIIVFYFFMFVVLGMHFAKTRSLSLLEHRIPLLLVIFLISSAIMYYVSLTHFFEGDEAVLDQTSIPYVIVGAMYAVATLSAPLLVASLGLRYFNHSYALIQRANESSFWVYIIHYPIVKLVFCLMFFVDLPVMLKIVISFLFISAASVLSYYWFVKGTFVERLLNGEPLWPSRVAT